MQMMKPESVQISFGKYRGKNLGYILRRDLLYLDWLAGIDLLKYPSLKEAVSVLTSRHSQEISTAMEQRDSKRDSDTDSEHSYPYDR